MIYRMIRLQCSTFRRRRSASLSEELLLLSLSLLLLAFSRSSSRRLSLLSPLCAGSPPVVTKCRMTSGNRR